MQKVELSIRSIFKCQKVSVGQRHHIDFIFIRYGFKITLFEQKMQKDNYNLMRPSSIHSLLETETPKSVSSKLVNSGEQLKSRCELVCNGCSCELDEGAAATCVL